MNALPSLADRLNAALPQTQCTRCAYPDCRGYAEAIAGGLAAINQCPPGGAEGIARLAKLTGLQVLPLNPAHGAEASRTVAVIDEAWCIGCTLCLPACPVDAIVGSNKQMHTVVEPHCTGCELCIAVCPVDCISLENASGPHSGWQAWSQDQAQAAQVRYAQHQARLAREEVSQVERHEEKAQATLADWPAATRHTDAAVVVQKRQVIEAALARARAKRTDR